MIPFEYENGIYLPELDLWLDPGRKRPLAFVSHAHADHARVHERLITSRATLALMRARNSGLREETALPFGEALKLDGGRVELFPAGHVLGSSQIRVLTDSGSLVYTGDFKLRLGLSCERAEIRNAEILIMETTYGHARYRFPPEEEVRQQIIEYCRECLESDIVPVLMGYSLGKAQEILMILKDTGFELVVHDAIMRMNGVYECFDQMIPECAPFQNQDLRGKVLILPPNVDRTRYIDPQLKTKIAVVSGWGLDSSARFRYRCDHVFPLSDHADYDELCQYVEQVNPKVVYTLHGYAEQFAQDLRARGREAWSVISNNQLEFLWDMHGKQ